MYFLINELILIKYCEGKVRSNAKNIIPVWEIYKSGD